MGRHWLTTLGRWANGRNMIVLLVLFMLMNIVVFPMAEARLKSLSGGVAGLDVLISYTPDAAYQRLAAYGNLGRRFYAAVELTADLIYPPIYSLLFSLVLAYLYRRALPRRSPVQYLALFPFAAGLADLLENLGITAMLALYPQRMDALARAANLATQAKWGLLLITLILGVIGLIAFLLRRLVFGPPVPR